MSREIVGHLRAAEALAPAARDEAHGKAIAAARRHIDGALALRKPFETKWAVAEAFLYGYQAVTVAAGRVEVDRGFAFTDTNETPFRANVIRPRVRTIVSMLTANQPRYQAVVGDADDASAQSAARLGDEWLSAVYGYTGTQEESLRAIASVLIAGRGYLMGGFDGSRGPTIEKRRCKRCGAYAAGAVENAASAAGRAAGAVDAVAGAGTDAPPPAPAAETATVVTVCAECGGPTAVVTVQKGDFYVAGLSAWDVVYDPAADRLARSPWVAIRWVMTKEEAENRYGGEFKVEKIDAGVDVHEIHHTTREGVVVWEMQWRKSRHYPLGLRMLFAGNRLLHSAERISGDGEFTIAEIRSDEEIRRPYSTGIVFDLVQAQIWENKVGQWLMKHAELTADPRIRAPEGSIRETDVYQDIPGRWLVYDPAMRDKPDYMPPPTGTATFAQAMAKTSQVLDFIAQQWEPARGQPGAGITSGLMAQIMIERTNTSFSIVTNTHEAALKRIGKVLLMEGQVRMPEGWLFALAGDYPRPKMKRFRGEDLAGIADVHVVAGSTRPDSKEARRGFYLELLKAIGGPVDETRRSVVEAMDAGVRLPADPFQTVRDKAADEDMRLARGEWVAPSENDFHDVEIREHLVFESSEEFRRAAPVAQALHRRHVKMHKDLMDFELMEREARKAAIAAAAAPAPTASMTADGADAALEAALQGGTA